MMMAEQPVLHVLLHGTAIGTITRFGGDRNLFAFADTYLADQNGPLLSLGFKDEFGGLIGDHAPTQTRLMPFFSNMLPEGHLRDYLAKRAKVNQEREFFLLWVLGQDLPGAVTVESADGEDLPAAVREQTEIEDNRRSRKPLRFSLAGVQLKFSAVRETGGGLTIPVKGVGGNWIVKLPSGKYQGVPENEFSMMTLAKLSGMNVPPVQLIDLEAIEGLPDGIGELTGQAFAIERFDRLADGGAIHIEDFAQILRVYPEQKYKGASYRYVTKILADVAAEADVAEFIRRLTFNSLIGNADMHLKNWSLIYPDGKQAALAPAYDFVSTIAYLPDEEAALKFSRTKRFDEFSEDELKHLAAKAAVPEKLVLTAARETVERFQEHWRKEKSNLPLTKNMAAAIDRQLTLVPVARPAAKGS